MPRLEFSLNLLKTCSGDFFFSRHEMQPPIAVLLLTPAGVCSLNNVLSKAINCWFVFHLLGRILISREKPCRLDSLYAVFLTFCPFCAFRPLKCLFSLEFAVLKLTLPLTYCSSLYHASDLTSVIVLPYLYLCCWQWCYGHLLEKWKHRTFCCLKKKKKTWQCNFSDDEGFICKRDTMAHKCN